MSSPEGLCMQVEAKSLRRGQESWELVVEKLVRVGPNYYKARRQCIRGQSEILQTLNRLNQPRLFEDARRAMDGPSRSYQVTGGRLEAAEGETEAASEGESDAVRRLVRHCAQLESRVEALERALRASKRRTKSSSPAPRPRSRSASQPAKAPSTSPSDAPKVAPASRAQERRDDMHGPASKTPPSFPEASAGTSTEEEAASEARLSFPDAASLGRAYADLIGEEMPLSETPPFAADDGSFYITEFLDESDAVIGALVLDRRAIVFQAGALTMLEEDERQVMFESGEPSADTLDAMKELLNAQGRCFNSLPGNPHIRLGVVRQLGPEEDAWVVNAEHIKALRDPFGGRMLLISR